MLRRVLITVLAVGTLAAACGDDDKGSSQNNVDGGSSQSGGGGGGGSGNVCMPTSGNQSYGTCTKAQVDEYSACVQTACDSKYKECFGSDYKKGNYSGPCKDALTCTSKCTDCNDSTCTNGCASLFTAGECSTCTSGFLSCSQSCFSKLTCATGGLLDAGINLSKTCKDLKSCCDSLSGSLQSACSQSYTALSAQGDVACSVAVGSFCPN